jgi:hypothetical protein
MIDLSTVQGEEPANPSGREKNSASTLSHHFQRMILTSIATKKAAQGRNFLVN